MILRIMIIFDWVKRSSNNAFQTNGDRASHRIR